ncbi:hypothetical protein [Gordonia sp. (in: high G+C Gram-positive bacteria)]|uniref:hypothetical protein n=1 Tax=Gordonia sp. (in: high G+C Gram-positive bacteria) TaxID=84139 RepID=UPI0039E2195F
MIVNHSRRYGLRRGFPLGAPRLAGRWARGLALWLRGLTVRLWGRERTPGCCGLAT